MRENVNAFDKNAIENVAFTKNLRRAKKEDTVLARR